MAYTSFRSYHWPQLFVCVHKTNKLHDLKKWQDVQEGTWSFGRSQVRIPAWFKELKSDLPFPDGASLPRDVPDEGVAQDPEV